MLVDMPWSTFALGTLLGLMPNNYILSTMGLTIAEASSLTKSWYAPVVLLGLGLLTLLPTLLKKNLEKYEEHRGAKIVSVAKVK
jgi:uncharacterized membrane protein YdjX (TVP38/TMEM64 family)